MYVFRLAGMFVGRMQVGVNILCCGRFHPSPLLPLLVRLTGLSQYVSHFSPFSGCLLKCICFLAVTGRCSRTRLSASSAVCRRPSPLPSRTRLNLLHHSSTLLPPLRRSLPQRLSFSFLLNRAVSCLSFDQCTRRATSLCSCLCTRD